MTSFIFQSPSCLRICPIHFFCLSLQVLINVLSSPTILNTSIPQYLNIMYITVYLVILILVIRERNMVKDWYLFCSILLSNKYLCHASSSEKKSIADCWSRAREQRSFCHFFYILNKALSVILTQLSHFWHKQTVFLYVLVEEWYCITVSKDYQFLDAAEFTECHSNEVI